MKKVVYLISIVVVFISLASAKTWHVPAEIPTIKSAVEDSAIYSDTVLVAPGLYSPATYEIFPINMKNGVVLISGQGADSTKIDADSSARVFMCENTDSLTLICGFSIMNGVAGNDTLVDTTFVDSCGGGILCKINAQIIIRENIIFNNHAHGAGGGIYCDSTSSPKILNNTIKENDVAYYGGGISCGGATHILNNTIILNDAWQGGGIACQNNSQVLIQDNLITNNNAHDGGGIASFYNASTNIVHNRICRNAGHNGGGFFSNCSADTIEHNIIQENNGSDGGGLFLTSASSKISQNVIAYNTATFEGSAMTIDCSNPSVIANTIVSNFNVASDLDAIFLKFGVSGSIISNNAIMDNRCGVYNHYWEAYNIAINNNNIYYNTYQLHDYEIKHFGIINNAIDARYNWWNTVDSTTIASYIWESSGPGHVLFVPFLMSPETNAPGEPSSIDSIVVMEDSTFSTPINEPVRIGDTLYIQLVGTSWHSSYIDPAIVILKSNKDSYGIGVALVETDTNGGVFRGKAYVVDTSNDLLNRIGVNSEDTIIIYANTDTAKCDTVIVGPAGIEQNRNNFINEIFFQSRPNPFSTSTIIQYSTSRYAGVSLKIYDISGRLVKSFNLTPPHSSLVSIVWSGDDDSGRELPAGIYFCRLKTNNGTRLKKLVLLR